MSDGIWSALSGAIAQERALEVVANNVANTNTVGFRADRLVFEEALAEAGADGPAPASLRYVEVAESAADTAQGALQQTGGALDLALEGDGFFAVRTPAGERYTRAGSFVTDAEGVLVTPQGHPVIAEGGDEDEPALIRIPPGTADVRIDESGSVFAGADQVGALRIVRFDEAPQKEGITLFTGQNAIDSDATVRQGYLEMANVNAVAGMNELITVSRTFEAFQKVIDTFQSLDQRTARDLAAG